MTAAITPFGMTMQRLNALLDPQETVHPEPATLCQAFHWLVCLYDRMGVDFRRAVIATGVEGTIECYWKRGQEDMVQLRIPPGGKAPSLYWRRQNLATGRTSGIVRDVTIGQVADAIAALYFTAS